MELRSVSEMPGTIIIESRVPCIVQRMVKPLSDNSAHYVAGLVSVILTTFNRPEFYESVIKSILEQDYNNMELIVVDDCSATENFSVLATLAKELQFKLVRMPNNSGVQKASIAGFEESKGEFLCFTGDDDIWIERTKVSDQVNAIRSFEADLVFSSVNRVDVSGERLDVVPSRESVDCLSRRGNFLGRMMSRNGLIYGSASMLTRNAYVQAGGFDPALPKGTDSDLFRRVILTGAAIAHLPNIYIDYTHGRGHSQMSAKSILSLKREMFAQLYILKKYSFLWLFFPSAALIRFLKFNRAILDYAIFKMKPKGG